MDIEASRYLLVSLAREVGVLDVSVGGCGWPGNIIGDPPAGAALVRLPGGGVGLHCVELDTPSHIEMALHELAHHVVGLDAERQCYEVAAVWALRFPVDVSTQVAVMAKESLA